MGGRPGANIRRAAMAVEENNRNKNSGREAIKSDCRTFGWNLARKLYDEGRLGVVSHEEIAERISNGISPYFIGSCFNTEEDRTTFIKVAIEGFEREKSRILNSINNSSRSHR